RRIFDHPSRQTHGGPFHFAPESTKRLQGPDSSRVKYNPSLCKACNTSRTSKHDRAYDRFSDWITEAQSDYSVSSLRWTEVYGSSHVEELERLQRYFAKSLGCKIVSLGVRV